MNKSSQRYTLIASSAGLVLVMLNISMVNPTLPEVQNALGASALTLQWIVNAYNLVFASLLLLGGLLGDRFGHRRVLLSGIGISMSGALLASMAVTPTILITARSIQGLGSAFVQPATLAILTYTFVDPQERARAIGFWAAMSGIGVALGPISGGLLVDALGWRSVFIVMLPIGVLAVIPTLAGVRETPQAQDKSVDMLGLILVVSALVALSLGLSFGQINGLMSGRSLTLFALASVTFVLFIVVEQRVAHPLVPLSAFRISTFATANIVGLFAFFGTFPLLTYLTIYFQQFVGLSATHTGFIIVLFPLAFAVCAPLGARLINHFGLRVPIVLGLMCSSLGSLSLLLMTTASAPANTSWSIALLGGGLGLSLGALTQAAVSSVPLERSGMASSLLGALRQVGTTLGIALLGTIITSTAYTHVEEQVDSLAVPSATIAQFTETVVEGRIAESNMFASDTDTQALQSVALTAYLTGLHTAFLLAGIFLMSGAILAWWFIKHPQRQSIADVLLPENEHTSERTIRQQH